MSNEQVKSYKHTLSNGQIRWAVTESMRNIPPQFKFKGIYHRIDGPAIYGGNKPEEWWLYGSYFETMNEWLEANDHLDENEKLIFKLQYS